MTKRQVLIALTVILLTTGALALDLNNPLKKQPLGFGHLDTELIGSRPANMPAPPAVDRQQKNPGENIEVPQHVIYDYVFRTVISLQQKATEKERQGQSPKRDRDFFHRQAGLSTQQVDTLLETAFEFTLAVEPLDARAKTIKEAFWIQHPAGTLAEGELLPAPPPEIDELQKQRSEFALSYRDKLRDLFGPEAFQRFDDFVQQKIGAAIHATRVTIPQAVKSSEQITTAQDSHQRSPKRRVGK